MDYHFPYLLILGLVGTIIWALNYWRVGKKPEVFVPEKLLSKKLNLFRVFLFVMGLVGWISLSYAIMGPRESYSFSKSSIKVNDIIFVLDVSRSMLAEDLPPNRLEVAKSKLQQFVKLRPKDRLGVIIFSEKVYTLLPLTTDPDLVTKVLGDVRVGFLGSGTNIGDALGLAVARAESSQTENKVIILLTDGVSNVESMTPEAAAREAKKYGIKVYTIGIGTDESARLPIGGGRYMMIPGGSIDMKTLRLISDMTGGRTYHAKSENSLKEILSDIEKLERTEIESGSQVVFNELFYPYLIFGVLLLFGVEFIRRFQLREVA